ncbi:MAG: TPM domain-containing protein [Treponema sp.]|nr:TPM domain-containing protein [Treponema sp.]
MELKIKFLNRRIRFLLILLAFCAIPLSAAKVPELKSRVNDYAGVISDKTEAEINEYLTALEEQTGIQIAVLTVQSLEGDDIASFGIKVADSWKIGSEANDNGAILIAAMQEHDIRIEVGDGLEGELTDAKCGLILRNVIIPSFREGDYSEGILEGVKNMGGVASGNMEIVSSSVQNGREEDVDIGSILAIIFWIVFFSVVVSSKCGIWKWLFFANVANNHYKRYTGWSGGSSRGFSSGGSSFHSSFHGGGGHFSGGGASGHW